MLRALMAALAAAALAACASPSGTRTGAEARSAGASEKLTTGDSVTFTNATPERPLRVPGTI